MNRFLFLRKVCLLFLWPLAGAELPEPYNKVDLLPFDPHGWYAHATTMEEIFEKVHPKVVIEVGCWLGKSTRHMASLLPEGGRVYAVDHWEGSVEHQPGQTCWNPKLPVLYQQFLSNVIHAELTDKIIPIRMDSIDASKFLAPLSADLIYIDAGHDFLSVYRDIEAWYPFVQGHGILCGDDYNWGDGLPTKGAVDQFAADHFLRVRVVGHSFWYYEE